MGKHEPDGQEPSRGGGRWRHRLLIALLAVMPLVLSAPYILTPPRHWRNILVGYLAWGVGAAIAEAYLRFHIERIRSFLHRSSLIIPPVVFLATMGIVGSSRGTLRFYEISAQLIPVLALVLLLQRWAFDIRRAKDAHDFFLMLVGLTLIGAGEYSALSAVFSGRASGAGVVAGAMAAAFASIALGALVGREGGAFGPNSSWKDAEPGSDD